MNFDRILIVAPHPDDEVIAAGGLIQRAADVRVVFLTAGENNPWPQRVMQRQWRITDADRAVWADLRRKEALASLEVLGVPRKCAIFLDFPDRRLAALARQGDPCLRNALHTIAADFQPSLVVAPSAQDFHADHRAASWYVHQAMSGEIITYVVHGNGVPARRQLTLSLTECERERKRHAIECHASQLLLSRKRFLSYARPHEEFFSSEHDLVCTDSPARERAANVRHACWVLIGGGRRHLRSEAVEWSTHSSSPLP